MNNNEDEYEYILRNIEENSTPHNNDKKSILDIINDSEYSISELDKQKVDNIFNYLISDGCVIPIQGLGPVSTSFTISDIESVKKGLKEYKKIHEDNEEA